MLKFASNGSFEIPTWISNDVPSGTVSSGSVVEFTKRVDVFRQRVKSEQHGNSVRDTEPWQQEFCSTEWHAPPPTHADLVLLAKLAVGWACEEIAVAAWNQSSRDTHAASQWRRDSANAAAWTSCHAAAFGTKRTRVPEAQFHLPHSSANWLVDDDLSHCISMMRTIREQKSSRTSCTPVLQVLSRCTSVGSRGWDTIVNAAFSKCVVTRRLVAKSLLVCLVGLHPYINPEDRMQWRDRAVLLDCVLLRRCLESETLLRAVPHATKAATRRLLVSGTSQCMAELDALRSLDHCLGTLSPSAFGEVPASLGTTMLELAHAGRAILHALRSGDQLNESLLIKHLANITDPPHVKTALRRTSGNRHNAAIDVAKDILEGCHFATFAPLWANVTAAECRAIRLSSEQLKQLHDENEAIKLVHDLPEQRRHLIHRLALQYPESASFTTSEVLKVLGIQHLPNAAKSITLANVRSYTELHSTLLAEFLCFCRVSNIKQNISVLNMGSQTRFMQAVAVLGRLKMNSLRNELLSGGIESLPAYETRIPSSARSITFCLCCQKIATACAPDNPKSEFTEFGVSGAMLNVCDNLTMHCAKRASASHRHAQTAVQQIACVRHTNEHRDRAAQILNGRADPAMLMRMRRDSKAAFEQRYDGGACSLDHMPMLDLMGSAVRIFGHWFTLCAFCGVVMKFSANSFVGVEPCCLACSPSVIGLDDPKVSTTNSAPSCRYCGKVQQARSVPHKRVKAPLDESGANAELPIPLRHVHFCSQHMRPWIPSSMRILPTRAVLVHIAFGCRPVHDVNSTTSSNTSGSKRRKRTRRFL